MALKRAVFLDKDGTLVEDVPFNVDPGKIRLKPYAAEALKMLKEAGFLLVVITNQAGIAYGFFKERMLHASFKKLQELLPIDAFFYCPHHPKGVIPKYSFRCHCRKPKPGLFLESSRRLGIDLGSSFMIGDIPDDAKAGKRAGCTSLLIGSGKTSFDCSKNLLFAARKILGET